MLRAGVRPVTMMRMGMEAELVNVTRALIDVKIDK